MKDNLLVRFLVILGITLLAAWQAWKVPPRMGIDLAGGTSLLYELDTSKLEGMDESELAAQVISVLKQRVDPKSQKNIIWRVVGGKRIQIQMPYPPADTLAARTAREQALAELQRIAWKRSVIATAADMAEPQRDEELRRFAPPESEAYRQLRALAAAADRLTDARTALRAYAIGQAPAQTVAAEYEARKIYNDALDQAMHNSVNPGELQNLANAADSSKEARARLAGIAEEYPLQKDAILGYLSAHNTFISLSGGGVDDPQELQRLVTRAGVLDFRIAVLPHEIGGLGSLEYLDARQHLEANGPGHVVNAAGTRARWYRVDPKGRDNFRGGYVTAEWAGELVVLCYDDTARSLTHSDPSRQSWSVRAGNPDFDPSQGGIVLPFSLDPRGAKYMGDLTSGNINHPMAILLDDRAMSAPNINSEITSSGVITFGRATPERSATSIQRDAMELKRIMDAGSLPATLRPEPISVVDISPDMGADNVRSALLASYISVAAVVLFMFMYYTLSGLFADVAMVLNLLLVLAVMAMFRGTFTLPGIAGLVLTLGMAVDANILINERIREEIHRGASLWMAIKQGYDRVFWTIFDSNLTTAITSIVLYNFGSEEIKGFGLTLLIGLMISMFTALFVTRTFLMAGVKWGIIRSIHDHALVGFFKELFSFSWLRGGHWPFMRVVTVSNIDWMGLRYYFWIASAIITLAGAVAFFVRGEEKYDIEFRGGTQITFQLREPTDQIPDLSLDQVRARIYELGKERLELRELETARVYGVGQPQQRRYEMQTTIANEDMEGFQAAMRQALEKTFSDLQSVEFPSESSVNFELKAPPEGVAPPSLQQIRERISALAATPRLEDLRTAPVDFAGLPGELKFQIRDAPLGIKRTLLPFLAEKFADVLDITPQVSIRGLSLTSSRDPDPRILREEGLLAPITEPSLQEVFRGTSAGNMPNVDVTPFKGGVAVLLDEISPPQTAATLRDRISSTRMDDQFSDIPHRDFQIIPLTAMGSSGPVEAAENDARPLVRAVLVTVSPEHPYDEENEAQLTKWRTFVAGAEWKILCSSLETERLFQGVTSFDPAVANQAKIRALLSVAVSLVLIIIYVWVRFGGILYGVGAILALIHDATMAVAATVISGYLYNHLFGGKSFLLINDFKINLTMVAAYLTIIGYSVNDTIVIFDRVRELRGKAVPLSRKLINDAINQCFGRTIWTSFTVLIVLLIMYLWAGEGVRGFCFAMIFGCITGVYSTLAIATPMLLLTGTGSAGRAGPRPENPFMRKERLPQAGS